MIRRNAILVAILVAQFFTFLVLVEIGDDVRLLKQRTQQQSTAPIMDKLAQLTADVQHLTHPQTVQRRTIDYILRQGEFEGIK